MILLHHQKNTFKANASVFFYFTKLRLIFADFIVAQYSIWACNVRYSFMFRSDFHTFNTMMNNLCSEFEHDLKSSARLSVILMCIRSLLDDVSQWIKNHKINSAIAVIGFYKKLSLKSRIFCLIVSHLHCSIGSSLFIFR